MTVRFWSTLLLVAVGTRLPAQQFSMSLGLNTGITSTYSVDKGIDNDPRYKQYYHVKFAPIGLHFGVNYEFIGFVVSPTITNIGQNSYVVNTSGGQNGTRESNLKYLNVPVAFKVHLINLAFLKVSGVASLSGAFLLDGSETVSHSETKLEFPKSVYPILPPDYTVDYDGVAVPAVDNYVITEKKDFKPVQVFAALGFQSDWDVSNHWRVIFDFRVNYGLFDPRTDEYLAKVNANQTLYDIPGDRHDMFVQLSVGIARYIEFEKSDQERKKKLKGTSRQYMPTKYPYKTRKRKQPGG